MTTAETPAAALQSQYDYVHLKLETFSVVRERRAEGTHMDGPAEAVTALRAIFATVDHDREHFVVLALDVRKRTIGYKVVSSGTAAACLVHPREVFRAALALGAHAVIVAHNHPSGEAVASPEDRSIACRLEEAGRILGIPVLDQFIVTAGAEPEQGAVVSYHSQRS